jgi:hypothetical protein
MHVIARLAALVPKPRVNLTRDHGVFAPNSHRRTPVLSVVEGGETAEEADRTTAAGHVAMTWTQRLKRVFHIDIETCNHCGGAVKIIACIEDPAVVEKILTHLNKQTACAKPAPLHESRAPPPVCVFD